MSPSSSPRLSQCVCPGGTVSSSRAFAAAVLSAGSTRAPHAWPACSSSRVWAPQGTSWAHPTSTGTPSRSPGQPPAPLGCPFYSCIWLWPRPCTWNVGSMKQRGSCSFTAGSWAPRMRHVFFVVVVGDWWLETKIGTVVVSNYCDLTGVAGWF